MIFRVVLLHIITYYYVAQTKLQKKMTTVIYLFHNFLADKVEILQKKYFRVVRYTL